MCLGVPGRIMSLWTEEDGAPMAIVDFAGEQRRICMAYLPELVVGDLVMAHLGYALTQVDEESAGTTTRLLREYGVLPPVARPGSAA